MFPAEYGHWKRSQETADLGIVAVLTSILTVLVIIIVVLLT